MSTPRTLFEKVWADHVVVEETSDTPAVLYIDLHLIHEVTTPQAFALLRDLDLPVRRPDLTLATMDHSTPTTPVSSFRDLAVVGEGAANQIRQMETNCRDFGIELYGFGSEHRGIVHVIGPELGASQPGKTIVCGDSHTSTHGAFGALAFGIGTTEVGHVLATQCLLQRKPKTLAIHVDGSMPPGVSAKDLILAVIGKIGVDGGTAHRQHTAERPGQQRPEAARQTPRDQAGRVEDPGADHVAGDQPGGVAGTEHALQRHRILFLG